ncbi:MAG: rod shape-determining protein MreC [Candidatus Omnitrophica bacterium]|nr:rod shape-determining protein MreC [Candidatus Omnitrophota bacterium]
MLWKFQKEFLFGLLLLISIFLFHLKADAFKPDKNPVATLTEYQNSTTRELSLENARLRVLLNLPKRKSGAIAAIGEVSTLDPIGWPSWLTVETDQAGRVSPGLIVLDARGNLVGHVTEKEGKRIKVMTILNPQNRVSVSIQESREAGILESTGLLNLTINYIPNDNSPRIGSNVITSKLSHNYLSGIPVGTIQASTVGKGFFRKILVRPSANFSSLEEVIIVY